MGIVALIRAIVYKLDQIHREWPDAHAWRFLVSLLPTVRRRSRVGLIVFLAAALLMTAAGCNDDDDESVSSGGTTPGGGGATELATADTVRLGFFANVTHAPAIVGVEEGLFEEKLGETKLETSTFNAGGEAVEALFADALDITFIGPNPAINAFAQSGGEAVRIVAGSTSGGAFLVVKPEINSSADLVGKKVATPALGNTQDVALRAWLADQGYETDTAGGGDVSIVPQANADTLTTFIDGQIDGAWLPEPWATRLIQEAGAKVLVDEADLWPDGQFVTTHLLVRTAFLEQYPGTVKAIIEAELEALQFIAENSDEAKAVTNAGIERITTKALPQEVIDAAWENLEFTPDPIAASLVKSAEDAVEADLLEPVELDGIYDLTLLNELLQAAGDPEVEGL
jgi:NitT/TauT family transport system substrate-binding protein